MSSAFADTHNMVAILAKSDASEGFYQILDFLTGSYIRYALNVNPHIYVSCIKQFWNTVTVKQSTDVTRLQALVDWKKAVISEAVIRDVLRLDDAEGVDCLPNEAIFTGLARIGYEKPSIKLKFYKAFFSSQWKFLIHTILQSLSAKRTSWNEFSSAMASAVICLSTVVQENVEEGIAGEQVQDDAAVATAPKDVTTTVEEDVQAPSIPSPPQDLPSTSHMHHTPPSSPQPQPQAQPQAADFPLSLLQTAFDICAALASRIKDEGIKLMGKKEKKQKDKEEKKKDIANDDQAEGRHAEKQAEIYQIDMNHATKVLSMHEDETEVQEVVDVVTTTKMITEVVAAVSEIVTAASVNIAAVPAVTITAAPVTVAAAYTRRRKGVVIRDPEEESITKNPAETPAKTKSKDKGKEIMVKEPKPIKKKDQVELDKEYVRKLHEELNKDIDWDTAIEHMKQKAKEDKTVQRYQVIKKRPHTEAQTRKNMMIHLKNIAGFKLDYFKGLSYDDIRLIFEAKFNTNMEFQLKSKEQIEEEKNRAIASINETLP
nr:hypothetical protein [Tanacetum cinerariifolium]